MLRLFKGASPNREGIDAIFKQAIAEKNNGEYKKSAILLEKILKQDPENEIIKLKLWEVNNELKKQPDPSDHNKAGIVLTPSTGNR